MSRVLAALTALLTVLVLAAPAHAQDGLWDDVPGVQHLHFETAPIKVRPGQNSIDNVVVPAAQKPAVDGFIVRARPDLVGLDGKVPPVDVIHLHHGVWLNASGTSPSAPLGDVQPIFFGGEEKTVFRIPRGYGYAYQATDNWILNEMIHNNTPNARRVRLVWDLDFIPADSALAETVKPVVPLWMDVRRGWGYPVFDVAQRSGGARRVHLPRRRARRPVSRRPAPERVHDAVARHGRRRRRPPAPRRPARRRRGRPQRREPPDLPLAGPLLRPGRARVVGRRR